MLRGSAFGQHGVAMSKLDGKVVISRQSKSLPSCLSIKDPELMAEAILQNIS